MGGRDQQILDAGAQLFYRCGFHNVAMNEIGEAVGISGPAIYRHFSGKDEILATLLNHAMDEIIRRTVPDADPQVELSRLLHSQTEFAVTHSELVAVYVRERRELQNPWKRQFQRRARLHEQHWIEVVQRCHPDADPERVAWASQATIGMIHSVALWSPPKGRSADVVEQITAMAFGALQALDASAETSFVNRR